MPVNKTDTEIVKKLDSLNIYSGKYPVGQWPTDFYCETCGQKLPLTDLKYNPYTKKRYCTDCGLQ